MKKNTYTKETELYFIFSYLFLLIDSHFHFLCVRVLFHLALGLVLALVAIPCGLCHIGTNLSLLKKKLWLYMHRNAKGSHVNL